MVRQRVNIVIPTIRDELFFKQFLRNWYKEFDGCHLIVVEDRQEKQFEELMEYWSKKSNFTYQLVDWEDIDEDLGNDAWIIPRQTDVVRNYGYLLAQRNDPLFILTLDDDVKPTSDGNYIINHYYNLFIKKGNNRYFSTMPNANVRGSEVFKNTQEIVVSHSGWLENPDYSANEQVITKLNKNYYSSENDFYTGVVPKGSYYSMCGMALAWKPKVTHWMYFPMQGLDTWGIDRCGDIWAGFYSKYHCDREGYLHHTGKPFVEHTRASNILSSIVKEKDSDEKGKLFIQWLEHGIKEGQMADYLDKLEMAYRIWERLINEINISGSKIQGRDKLDYRV